MDRLAKNPELAERDVSSLSKGFLRRGGDAAEVLRNIRAQFPNLRLWNFYGQTEMASLATAWPPHEQDEFAGSAGPALNVGPESGFRSGRERGPGRHGW